MATAPGSLSFTDPITQLASRNLREPQKDVFLAQQATSKEAEPLLDQKAAATAQAAQANIDADTRVTQQRQDLTGQLQDYSKFTPTPENKDNLTRLFALTAATTFLGGGGRQSGVNAMTNLSSAMQGYGQGREDLFQRELQQYHENMAQTREHNQLIQSKIQEVMQLWNVDRDKAQQELTKLAASTDSALIKNAAKMGNLDKLSTALQNQQKADMQLKVLQARLGGAPGALLPPDTIKAMAAQGRAGDRTVFQNLGRGIQGAQNLVALRTEMIRQYMEEEGMTPQQAGIAAASATAEFEGMKAGERALGTRTAQADMAVSEFEKVLPIALKASAEVPRGSFVPANEALQKWQAKTGDPKIRAFGASVNTLVNVYARAINPQGVGTVSDKEHAREILSTADSPEAFKAVAAILMQEAQAAKASPRQVKMDMREGFAAGRGGSTADEEMPDASQYEGKTLTDTHTNKKYRSDGKKWVPL